MKKGSIQIILGDSECYGRGWVPRDGKSIFFGREEYLLPVGVRAYAHDDQDYEIVVRTPRGYRRPIIRDFELEISE